MGVWVFGVLFRAGSGIAALHGIPIPGIAALHGIPVPGISALHGIPVLFYPNSGEPNPMKRRLNP